MCVAFGSSLDLRIKTKGSGGATCNKFPRSLLGLGFQHRTLGEEAWGEARTTHCLPCALSGKLANAHHKIRYGIPPRQKEYRVLLIEWILQLTTSCCPFPPIVDNDADGPSSPSLEPKAEPITPPFPSPPPPPEPPAAATAAAAISDGRLSVQNSIPVQMFDCRASTMRGTPSFSRSPPPVRAR